MSDLTATITSYGKEILARLKGDENQAIAAINERKARSAFKGQVSALESKIVDLEDVVTEKKEALENAIYPVTKITNNQNFIDAVMAAKNALVEAEEDLEDAKEALAFFQDLAETRFK